MDHSDKRNSPRLRRRFKVTVGTTSWFTTDVGKGGFGAETARAPIPGADVIGIISGKDVEVAFAGKIAWSLRGNMHMSVRSRTGVRFTRVGPTLAALLADGHVGHPDAS
jgi:hypothetical protein